MASHLQVSLRDQQIAAIDKVLNLNSPNNAAIAAGADSDETTLTRLKQLLTDDGLPIWKVLIYDDMGRNVISSVMHVSDLRKRGVTNYLHINQTRTPIPDVPVVYLVEPTEANIDHICTDLANGLYSPAYVNFLQSVPRPLLERFALKIAETETSEHIAQVFDQYLNFIIGEPDLFSLGMGAGPYWAMNSAKVSDEEIDTAVDRIVSGLFSVAVTMGSIPIIRCPKGGSADIIATKLDRKLRDHILNSKDNLFSGDSQGSLAPAPTQRPVMIIVDRNLDLIPMLAHSWIYQSLVSDILELKLNSITVTTSSEKEPSKPTKKVYSIDPHDFIWAQNAGNPFEHVTDNIGQELAKYMAEAGEITKNAGVDSLDELSTNDPTSSTAHLKNVIDRLPELQERKALIDKNINIATAILNGIQDRKLDKYNQLEDGISKISTAQMLTHINEPAGGSNPNDRVRLFVIWFLTTNESVSNAEYKRFGIALEAIGADVSLLPYINQVREITRMTMLASTASNNPTQPSSSSNALFSSISSRLTRFKDAGIGTNIEGLLSGVRNFLPVNKDYTLTKVVESIMDPQNASTSAIAKTENYLFFDPRSANARGILPDASQARSGRDMATSSSRGIEASFGQKRQGYSDAIVFTVGGGSMEEYSNLQEWVKRKNTSGGTTVTAGLKKRIVYGSTEVMSPEEFMTKELARLGTEISS